MKKEIVIDLDLEDFNVLINGGVLELAVVPLNKKISIFLHLISDYELTDAVHQAVISKQNKFRRRKKIIPCVWKNLTEFLSNKDINKKSHETRD